MNIVFDIYYFLYKNIWKKLGISRGQGFLLDFFLTVVGRSNSEYSIRISDGRIFRGDLWNIRYRALFWYRTHEPIETLLFKNLVRSGDVVLDVGANIGWYTTLAGELVGSGKVYAFEPVDIVASELQKNVNLNQLTNVTVQQIALSDRSGFGHIWFAVEDWGLSSLIQRNPLKSIKHSIELQTLDDWVKENRMKTITFIKCDIEGAETLFLKGGMTTLQRFQPLIMMELNAPTLNNFGLQVDELLKIFFELGYGVYAIQPNPNNNIVFTKLGVKSHIMMQVNILAVPEGNKELYDRFVGVIECCDSTRT